MGPRDQKDSGACHDRNRLVLDLRPGRNHPAIQDGGILHSHRTFEQAIVFSDTHAHRGHVALDTSRHRGECSMAVILRGSIGTNSHCVVVGLQFCMGVGQSSWN